MKYEPQLIHGNCLEVLKTMPDNSVDAVVTDPPYELGFMGKSWDSSGIAFTSDVWAECLRVVKPGGHLLAFSGSRTYHRMTVAIEDAGFEIRDQIMWVHGSGFPKSLDVSKAIDKAAGAERQIIGKHSNQQSTKPHLAMGEYWKESPDITTPPTDEAQQWSGWGTALKPAHEPIVMARKPLGEKTVAENVLRYGTGAINIDASRVEGKLEGDPNRFAKTDGGSFNKFTQSAPVVRTEGRFPANFIHDGSDEVLELFPESNGGAAPKQSHTPAGEHYRGGWGTISRENRIEYGSGSAARFFYCAKTSSAERQFAAEHNTHPTVKPLALMRYLVRLVTPPEGTVLDPFAGSGSTLVAAALEGFASVGIELTDDYLPIIRSRIDWAMQQAVQMTLF